jgi:hypothetical protein
MEEEKANRIPIKKMRPTAGKENEADRMERKGLSQNDYPN